MDSNIDLVRLDLREIEDIVEDLISVCADVRMISSHWLCSAESRVVLNRSIVPSTPVIGVRNSWLMTARNRDFARLAASACSRALVIAWAVSTASVMLRATPR